MQKNNKQQGMALIIVLLVLSVMTAIASQLFRSNEVLVNKYTSSQDIEQAYFYALSFEALAKEVLRNDFKDSPTNTHLNQFWANKDKVPFPVTYGVISGEIQDLQACFNINALAEPLSEQERQNNPSGMTLAEKQFYNILIAEGFEDSFARSITDKIGDFVDNDDDIRGLFGEESSSYQSRLYPYNAANHLMAHHSELRAVLGISQELYKILIKNICVIPNEDKQQLNVNTITIEQSGLLSGMLEGKISIDEAKRILSSRPDYGWDNITSFFAQSDFVNLKLSPKLKATFTVKTKYFKAIGNVEVNNFTLQTESVLQRENGKFFVLTRQYGGQG